MRRPGTISKSIIAALSGLRGTITYRDQSAYGDNALRDSAAENTCRVNRRTRIECSRVFSGAELLPDAERSEDSPEEIIGGELTGNFRERVLDLQ